MSGVVERTPHGKRPLSCVVLAPTVVLWTEYDGACYRRIFIFYRTQPLIVRQLDRVPHMSRLGLKIDLNL